MSEDEQNQGPDKSKVWDVRMHDDECECGECKGKERPCSVCGDNMYDSNLDWSFVGLALSLEPEDKDATLHKETKKMMETFGTLKIEICFTCWMKGMGVKPLKKKGGKK